MARFSKKDKEVMASKHYGAVVGRFQVHRLTAGHLWLLHQAARGKDGLIVLIGSRETPRTATNPLPFEARKAMIKEEFPNAYVLEVWDHQSDQVWSERLDDMVSKMFSHSQVTFYVGRDSFKPHYHGKYPIVDLGSEIDTNATAVREKIGKTLHHNEEFRAGIIWSMENLTPRIYLTVDMAMARFPHSGPEILLVRRPNSDLWQISGGFVEPGESFADAAAREIMEETKSYSVTGWDYLGDFPIQDWRIRGAKGVSHKTILMFGVCDDMVSDPIPSDDLEGGDAKFFPVETVEANFSEMIKPMHQPLVKKALCAIAGRKNLYYISSAKQDVNF